jgi:SecD/SecF fusion protein
MHRKFWRDSLICLLPCLVAAVVVVHAYFHNGFKLGVDLVGGTILIYEVDQDRERQRRSLEDAKGATFQGAKTSQALAESVKRRIDPDDVQNITVRPAGDNRIEVILPMSKLNAGDIAKVRKLIEQVGSLEFRIVANEHDDAPAINATEKMFKDDWTEYQKKKQEWQQEVDQGKTVKAPVNTMEQLALGGDLPPVPEPPANEPWEVKGVKARYQWAELSKLQRAEIGKNNSEDPASLGLVNANEDAKDPSKVSRLWLELQKARKTQDVVRYGNNLFYSRACTNVNLPEDVRKKKKYEYFILTRITDRVVVDGTRVTISAQPGQDSKSLRPSVNFSFNSEGGREFYAMTSRNKPEQDGRVTRQLAIILNGEVISYPTLQAAISDNGQITGNFDQDYVNEIVKLLRSGALPATLKQKPVSESTVGATLGEDTVKSGTRAVGLSFIAVLIFMAVYYRFAGLVACTALLANLLLTVGFMVAVNATFTLPGLAGLVLMLGMAVDANVLIYERLREERDRGANLQMAIRNAYDRAFPTIIDTHLSSIFTAIVLYAVGNDQLRGFGVSLTAGLIISLFTSLFMTRLFFDIWMKRHWLTNLKMMRLLTRPSIDFMKIRHLMFAATGTLTILGLALFLWRGERGLNVDFVGGTVYGGQLQDDTDISKLRQIMSEDRQAKMLEVEWVKKDPADPGQSVYLVKYAAEAEPRRIQLALGIEGKTDDEKLENLKKRAAQVPDWSVEQNFLGDSTSDKSKYFTVRTTEKEPDLVGAEIDRLFRDDGKSLLAQTLLSVTQAPGEAYSWELKFTDRSGNERYSTEAFIRTLLEREFRAAIPKDDAVLEPFRLQGMGEAKDGRYAEMRLTLSPAAQAISTLDTKKVLEKVVQEYNQQPQPERLETFDPTLAGETQTRALIAIVASWAAILLYLWFRFGNWTFGAAAVICLIHDLCFTLGAIALCHFVGDTTVGKFLGLQDFKIDFAAVAALLTLIGYSVNDTIVVFDRIREVRGKNPLLTAQTINDSVNQTLSRTVLAATTVFLVVVMLYFFGGDGIHLFAFVMVVGVLVGTYSSIYVASPLLLIFGEGTPEKRVSRGSALASREAAATA